MKWLKRVLLSIVVLVVLAFAGLYASSQYVINQHYSAEPRALTLASFEPAPAEGERLAQLFGCYRGCHGRHMQGDLAFDEPPIMKAVAPSLIDAVEKYTTQELEALIRQGVRPDGRSLWGMPSGSFASMTDRDLAMVLAFIEAYPEHESEVESPGAKFYIVGRYGLLSGLLEAEAAVAARFKPFDESTLDDPLVHGRYLALNICSECHNTTLDGYEGFTPSLTVAKGYDREQFKRLMSEGIGLGDRDLGLMSEVAKMRFSHFKDGEVDDLYDFLQSR